MFAKTLIKLIDYSIFPAILIVAAKILGIVFFARYFNAQYYVQGMKMVFDNAESFAAINTYSSLIMFFAVLAGLLWVVVKAHVFHDTHIAPALSSELFNMDLHELIHTTEVIFSQAFIWLSYTWITTVIFGVHAYFGLGSAWLFYMALAISILLTAVLAVDIEREIVKDEEGFEEDDDAPEKIIRFEELRKEILG